MSSDNGVYIAEFYSTNKEEIHNIHYRVVHTQNIEEIDCAYREEGEEAGKEMAREFFEDAPRFASYSIALEHALNIHDDLTICEYGVCFVGKYVDVFEPKVEDRDGAPPGARHDWM